jgi:hypothetical protein
VQFSGITSEENSLTAGPFDPAGAHIPLLPRGATTRIPPFVKETSPVIKQITRNLSDCFHL